MLSPSRFNVAACLMLVFMLFFCNVFCKEMKVDPNYGQECSPSDISKCGDPFICTGNFTCGECAHSSDCHGFYSPAYICSLAEFNIRQPNGSIVATQLHSCQQKDLFPHFTIWDALAILLCFFGGTLAASSGIGGGAIYVVALIAVGRMPSKTAAPLSTACIFGTAISNILLLSLQRHPYVKRPLIDYSTVLLTEPIILSGTILGVFLNVMFPNWLILMILVIVLSLSSYKTFTKGLKTYKKENAEKKARAKQLNESPQEEAWIDSAENDNVDLSDEYAPPVMGDPYVNHADISLDAQGITPYSKETPANGDEDIVNPFETDLQSGLSEQDKEKLEKMKRREACQFPILKFVYLGFAWVVVFLASLLKGSKGNQSLIGIESCRDPWYWVIILITFPILLCISFGTGLSMRLQYSKKQKWGYEYAPGDVKWTTARAFLLPLLFLFAGILASLLGIGGGILQAPLLLELGMIPQVSMATSSFMIFFTSSSTLMQYIFMGSISLWYVVGFIVTGMLSGAVGQLLVGYIVRRSGRGSIIIFIISITIAVATVLQVGLGLYNIITDIQQGILSFSRPGFKAPC